MAEVRRKRPFLRYSNLVLETDSEAAAYLLTVAAWESLPAKWRRYRMELADFLSVEVRYVQSKGVVAADALSRQGKYIQPASSHLLQVARTLDLSEHDLLQVADAMIAALPGMLEPLSNGVSSVTGEGIAPGVSTSSISVASSSSPPIIGINSPGVSGSAEAIHDWQMRSALLLHAQVRDAEIGVLYEQTKTAAIPLTETSIETKSFFFIQKEGKYQGLLCRRAIDEKYTSYTQMVVPKAFRQIILKEMHGVFHAKQKALYNELRRLYYWENMQSDVVTFVRHCRECQIHSTKQRKQPAADYKSRQVSRAFEIWSADVFNLSIPSEGSCSSRLSNWVCCVGAY